MRFVWYMLTKKNNLRFTLWFTRKQTFDIDYFDLLQPTRTVSEHGRYKSGLFYSAKCKRDIQYESALELRFIERLEADKNVLFYWEQPIRIPYKRGNIRDKWTPDFGIYLKSRHFVIAEVKPLGEMITHRVQAKAEGLMEYCSRKGFGLLLTDGRNTPEKILKGKINRALERELRVGVESGPIREYQYREIKKRCNAKPSELYRAIIRLDLKFATRSFKIQRGNQSPVFRAVYFKKKKYDDVRIDLSLLREWFG